MNGKKEKLEKDTFLGKKRKYQHKILKNNKNAINNSKKFNIKTQKRLKPIKNCEKETTIDFNKSNKKNIQNKHINITKPQDIPESNIIIASENDFIDPIDFFDKLFTNKDNLSGVVKIIPPGEWKANYDAILEKFYKKRFLEKDFKLEVRMQLLKNLLLGKKFDFSKKFNFAEYKIQSDNSLRYFEKTYNKNITNSNNIQEIEKLYWNLVKSDKEEKVYYIADLPFLKYFSKRDISEMNNIKENNPSKFKNNQNRLWTLQSINLLDNSLFQFLKKEQKSNISGLTVPWLYFGMIFSTFCWHVEDLFLYSLNYMHYGSPKVWYSIPVNEKEKMDKYLLKKYEELKCKNKNLVDKLTLLIDPVELSNNDIKVNKIIQYPGEIILTFPNAYHAGFSTGFNISEAVNFSTIEWLNYGKMATKQYINQNLKTPVFPIEWLIFKNYRNLDISKFTKIKNKNEIISQYNKIKKNEFSLRRKTEEFFKYKNYKINILSYNDDWDYSNLNCELCKRYAFFSIIECRKCFKKCCLVDKKPCDCATSNNLSFYNIYYRKL